MIKFWLGDLMVVSNRPWFGTYTYEVWYSIKQPGLACGLRWFS